ncbi:hypothetical protein F3Y22_tig00000329pilonHSYRG00059 [Hibiscus syriacus]|uniref:Uncharacterized protein n=1 Tax=Hibiscus syriacus TaxID=106335 RepID=A0A6A3D9F2_HIBSY|nr:hypothetical protein F3Y22_tig00000329pilonHSYRG00059 [Hibiscus syriacus]
MEKCMIYTSHFTIHGGTKSAESLNGEKLSLGFLKVVNFDIKLRPKSRRIILNIHNGIAVAVQYYEILQVKVARSRPIRASRLPQACRRGKCKAQEAQAVHRTCSLQVDLGLAELIRYCRKCSNPSFLTQRLAWAAAADPLDPSTMSFPLSLDISLRWIAD